MGFCDPKASRKRKYVADGVFFAELNEFFRRTLSSFGFSGMKLEKAPLECTIVICVIKNPKQLTDGSKHKRVRELELLVEKRFGFRPNYIHIVVDKAAYRGQSALAQAESLRYKIISGLAVRRACYGILRFVMEKDCKTKGCEVTVSGKLRAQRAKVMKFTDGYMISTGNPAKEYIDEAYCHVMMKQGILGVKVKIMLSHDPAGKAGPSTPLPDSVRIKKPQDFPGEEDDNENEEDVPVPEADYIQEQGENYEEDYANAHHAGMDPYMAGGDQYYSSYHNRGYNHDEYHH
jgi:small subunit ribosomal protein S3e